MLSYRFESLFTSWLKLPRKEVCNLHYQIIVRTYNQEKAIIDLLNSIKYQASIYGKNKKTIVYIINDASIDNTEETIYKWISQNLVAFIEYYIVNNIENKGYLGTYLQMFELINSKKYIFVDGDDIISKNSIYDFIDFALDKSFTFSPIIIYSQGKIYPNFSFLRIWLVKIKLVLFKPKNFTMKNNFFNLPGSHIGFDIAKSQDFINFVIRNKQFQGDFSSWVYMLDNGFIFSLYSKPIIIYRPSKSHPYLNNVYKSIIMLLIRIFTTPFKHLRIINNSPLHQFSYDSNQILDYIHSMERGLD